VSIVSWIERFEHAALSVPEHSINEYNVIRDPAFSDPGGAGIVHHLTVPCYMLQHDRYSDEGAAWVLGLLEATLERGISPDSYRAQTRATVDQARRARASPGR